MILEKNIDISICITTYNQAMYIENTIESVLSQVTDFSFQIIVVDDCSTDRTVEIVEKIAYENPEIVKLVLNKENIGGEKNFFKAHSYAEGRFVCILDGDDLMLPGKLHKQAMFMNNNQKCNLCFHRVNYLLKSGEIRNDNVDVSKISNGFDRGDIIRLMAVATHSSKMYRNGTLNFEEVDFIVSDWFMNIKQVGKEKAYYISDEVLGSYRVGVGQSSAARDKMENMIIDTIEYLIKKHPEENRNLNSVCFFYILKSIKNLNANIFRRVVKLYLVTFKFSSVVQLYKDLKIRHMFRII